MKKYAFFVFVLLFFVACSPFTKEAYLDRYREFMSEVSSDYRTFDENDWAEADKEFDRLNNEWFNKFKDDLTNREKITISAHKIRYNTLKRAQSAGGYIEGLLREDVSRMREQLEQWVENNMQDELDIFLEEAKRIGREAYEEALRMVERVRTEEEEEQKE